MDTTGFSTRYRAEALSRQAAAQAHATYYAHPSLHLSTYLNGPAPILNPAGGDQSDNTLTQPLNEANPTIPAAPSLAPQPGTNEKKSGTEGTREEQGGKEDSGKPSGLDKGAREINGEAGGTNTSPGPAAEEVRKFEEMIGSQGNGQRAEGAVNWSVEEKMNPHLQLMCGPLLAYYTTKDNVWQGGAMVVTTDEGSVYEPAPRLDLSFHLYSPPSESVPTLYETEAEPILQSQRLTAQKILTFDSAVGSNSFWRFIIEIPLQPVEMTVRYRLNGGAAMDFVIPALYQNFRWAAHSCNGFSSGINPEEFKGPFQSGYDPVWEDMLLQHHKKPFHCMVGGGDQIYCDAITREPELQPWINAPNKDAKLATPLTEEIKTAVDRFYFNHYCKIFRSNAFGRANSSIPMVNMLDDHDLIDGFGTYDDATQAAPVMSFVGSRGYFWFLVFQLFVVDAVDGTNPTPGTHTLKSLIIGGPGAWIPFPSHSLLVYLGPKVSLLAIDCRAERKLNRIVTKETYQKLFTEVRKAKGMEQLVVLLGVPIAYPRMSFLEHFLDFKYNPLNMLARHNAFGLGGMVNKFNQASELLDDLNDHWCANTHKKERNWLVMEIQRLALDLGARITFLSGDVHLAAVGCLFTKGKNLAPEKDHRYMLNIITSAIVNTPPPPGAAYMVAALGTHKHRTLHKMNTDERMIPLFEKETDGSKKRRPRVQARRNYTAVEYKQTGELVFDFRVEKEQGLGETVSYPITCPAPRWDVAI